jgi:DNA-binding beta-propeller fold protein YncE
MSSKLASAAVALILLAPAAPAAARVGALTQLPGKAGCMTQQDAPAKARRDCTVGRFAGRQMWDLAVSPDGRDLYVASIGGAVSVLRIGSGGRLRQLAGKAGCMSTTGRAGCREVRQLAHSETVAVSPDGRTVYVGVSARGVGGVLTFARDKRTGALRKTGCLGEGGNRGCTTVRTNFRGPADLAVSPDGRSVYMASGDRSGIGAGIVVVFARAGDGSLSEPAGPAGCLNADGSAGCTQARALLPDCCGIAVSPDSRDVYLSSWQSVPASSPTGLDSAHFSLDSFSRGGGGALTQFGCVNQDGSDGCTAAPFKGDQPLNTSGDIVISANGRNLYLAHSSTFPSAEAAICGASDNFIAMFPRDPSSGTLGPLAQDMGVCGSIPALSPDGKSLYGVTGNFGNEVSIFSRDRANGLLSPAGCIDPYDRPCQKPRHLTAPSALAITPDGRHVYVVSDDPAFGETIGVFKRSLR